MWRFLLFALALCSGELLGQDRPSTLKVYFFDVGQGDAVLIQAPTGQRVLVDAGPDDRIVEQLRRVGVDTIDLFIASHNHVDHIGGAAAVLRSFPVRFYMDNGIPHTTVTYQNLLETVQELDIPLLEPERRVIELGEAVLEILPPPGDAMLDQNNNSIGAAVRFGNFRAFFGGDAEGHLWRYWMERFLEAMPRVKVHKASHHGSRAGDIREALERLRPQFVVICVGADNRYGHPHAEALALYAQAGATILSTAERGTILISGTVDGSVSVSTDNPEVAAPQVVAPRVEVVSGCVDLNRASSDRLQEIAHLGPDRAAEIVRMRAGQPFRSVEDLTRLSGIGPARIRDIVAQGLACVRD